MKNHIYFLLIGFVSILYVLTSSGVAYNGENHNNVSSYLQNHIVKAHIKADTNDEIHPANYSVDSSGLIQNGEDVRTGNLDTNWWQAINHKIYTLKAQWRAEPISLQRVTRSWMQGLVSRVWADGDEPFRSSRSEARISYDVERNKTYYFAFDVAVIENGWSNESWQVVQQFVEHSLGKSPTINLTLKSEPFWPSSFDNQGNETVNTRNYFSIENNNYRYNYTKQLGDKIPATPGWHKFEYVFKYSGLYRDTFIVWHNGNIVYDSSDYETFRVPSILSQCSYEWRFRDDSCSNQNYDGRLSVKTWIYRWYDSDNEATELWYRNIYLAELDLTTFPE